MKTGSEPAMPSSILEWGAAGQPLDAGSESGDLHLVAPFPGGAVVALADGLGHGPEAAVAARSAVDVLKRFPQEPVVALIHRCHEALRRTRGAVMTLASFSAHEPVMTWVGVGNVEGVLVRADPTANPTREGLGLRAGVVGYQLPPLRPATLPVAPGDTLILVTDGIRSGYSAEPISNRSARELAHAILAGYRKGSDDAGVVVARYVGVGR